MQIVIHLLKQVPSLNLNPEVDFWLHAAIFKNRYDVITLLWSAWFTTKFGRLKQNQMPWTKHRSESKSEVRFQ